MSITDWIGFSGVSLLLVAFFLNLRGYVQRNGIAYLGMNTLGAGLACLASVMLEYWPFIILEGCWAIVSLVGLVRAIPHRSW